MWEDVGHLQKAVQTYYRYHWLKRGDPDASRETANLHIRTIGGFRLYLERFCTSETIQISHRAELTRGLYILSAESLARVVVNYNTTNIPCLSPNAPTSEIA